MPWPKHPRQTSTAQRLAELRRAHPHDATLQNLLAILSVKLDLSARLPVFEYEADSEGFSDTASFLSSLASAERESLQDILTSLRLHLDRTAGPLHAGGDIVISVALVADSGPAMEAMTRSVATLAQRQHRAPLPRPRPDRPRARALRP